MTYYKTIALLAFIALGNTSAFTSPQASINTRLAPLNAYIPDGLTPEEYKRVKAEDKKKLGKDLGRLGPRGFVSRSMQAWQEAYEKGIGGHEFAAVGYKQKLQKGEIKREDVPYMIRGGSWDNSDVFGARRRQLLKTDKEYAKGGYKKEQSASILGSGPGFDWTGSRPREQNLRRVVPGLS